MPPSSPLLGEASSEAEDAGGEAELLNRLRAGDDGAYTTLVRTHAGRMLAVARRLLKNENDAEDAVQDAFLSAFRSLDSFHGQARLGTWLHRVVVNAALMRLRSRGRRPEISIEDLLPRFLEDGHFKAPPQRWNENAETLLQSADRRRWVRGHIDGLPDAYRTVLLLRDIEEISTKETAEILGITPNAVKIRLHRARLALRETLDRELREEAP